MWRPEDQALLERLEDEETVAALWRIEAPGAAPLHPRAAGMVQAVRSLDGGAEAVAALRGGDPQPLLGRVRPPAMTGLPAELLHHLAVYNERLATASSVDPELAEQARLCSLAAWIALAEQRDYLRALAAALVDDGEEAKRALAEAAMEPIEELGREALAGARELDPRAQRALRTLARVSDACRRSGCSATVGLRFERRAERLRARAIEAALAPIQEALSDATARGRAEREGGELMERVTRVWRWADEDEHVERFAIDAVTPIAWNVYHEENADAALRRLIGPLEPLVDRLAWRIEDDATRIAYAAPCAQMYVFRSEISTSAEERKRWAERSLEICPRHRNGRLILASLLVHEVRDRLDRAAMFMRGSDFAELEAQLGRARDLYPRARGLAELEERVARAREELVGAMSNPFERFDIDPMHGPAAITERMRELAEEADETEREALREVWEDLTMHPRRRLLLALRAFPETRAEAGAAPPPPRFPALEADRPLTLAELVVTPLVAAVLSAGEERLPSVLPPIESDPFLEPNNTAE